MIIDLPSPVATYNSLPLLCTGFKQTRQLKIWLDFKLEPVTKTFAIFITDNALSKNYGLLKYCGFDLTLSSHCWISFEVNSATYFVGDYLLIIFFKNSEV